MIGVAMAALALAADTAGAAELLRLGRSQEAAEAYRKLVKESPGDPELLAGLGRSLLAAKRPLEAIPPLVEAVGVLATDRELRKTLARAYQQANLLPQAEPLLNQLLTEDLNDGECWRLFGLLLYQNGYYSTALRAFERSLAIGASAEAAAHRAVCLVQLGRFTEAEIAIREIEGRADAGNVDLLIARVQLLYETGRLEVALNAAESAVASRPGHPMTLYWRGTIRFRLGRLDQALRDAHASIAASPGLPFGRNLVVRIRRAQGRLADAAAEVEWLRQYEEAKTRRSGPELPQ